MNRRDLIKTIGVVSAGMALFPSFRTGGMTKPEKSTYFTLSYRLHPNMITTEDLFKATSALLMQYKPAVHELAFFDETFPSSPSAPLEYVEKMAELYEIRIQDFKKIGVPRVGIDILNTLGHGDKMENWPMPFQPMIGHDGRRATSPCYNDKTFVDYITEKVAILARAKPDFIWIDDDFRVGHHGAGYPCFCPICLEKFGDADSRETMVAKLNKPENSELRKEWSDFHAVSLEQLAKKLKESIHKVNPDIEIGLMTIGYSNNTYAGNDMTGLMKAFEASMGRPGHGFYHDDQPRQITDKLFDVMRQVRDYPESVKRAEYELENWPYIILNKSVGTVINESLLALMAGCNGITYNMFYERDDLNYADYKPLMEQIFKNEPLWEKVVEYSSGLNLSGFWPVDNPDLMALRKVGDEGWFSQGSNYDIQTPNELAETGIPFSGSFENSCGVFLSGRIAETFSNEELKKMLSGAVYMDTAALNVLWERGLGEYAGVKHVNDSVIAVEIFSDHPINQGIEGTMRRAEGWSRGTYLEIINDDVEVINNLHVMTTQELKGPCLTVFENKLGGRIAVSGYHPWQNVGMLKKVTQLTRLMNYLSAGKMPVIIEKPYRILPLMRTSRDGNRFVLSLFNNSFDEITNLPVQLKSVANEIVQLKPDANKKLRVKKANGNLNISIDKIEPWSIIVLAGK